MLNNFKNYLSYILKNVPSANGGVVQTGLVNTSGSTMGFYAGGGNINFMTYGGYNWGILSGLSIGIDTYNGDYDNDAYTQSNTVSSTNSVSVNTGGVDAGLQSILTVSIRPSSECTVKHIGIYKEIYISDYQTSSFLLAVIPCDIHFDTNETKSVVINLLTHSAVESNN